MAAVVVGTVAVGAGWGWGALLVAFFVSSSLLSRIGAAGKARRTAAIVAKGGERDAWQVLANGGVFALAALGSVVWPGAGWGLLATGALAAAAADTWATEIGTMARQRPRSVIGFRPVPAGTSGAVTVLGLAGSVAGAAFVGGVASMAGVAAVAVGRPAALIVVAGVTGALSDTMLGATLQARRHCPACDVATERIVHSCGEQTRPAGGVPWMDNDVVNLLATTVGAVVALAAGA